MPGAEYTFAALRDAGVRVCLATGFSPVTRDAIISRLGWGSLIDLALSPADDRRPASPRGRLSILSRRNDG